MPLYLTFPSICPEPVLANHVLPGDDTVAHQSSRRRFVATGGVEIITEAQKLMGLAREERTAATRALGAVVCAVVGAVGAVLCAVVCAVGVPCVQWCVSVCIMLA